MSSMLILAVGVIISWFLFKTVKNILNYPWTTEHAISANDLKTGNMSKQELDRLEITFAEELRRICDNDGKEKDKREAGKIFHKLGLLYWVRNPSDKISLIRSAGLLNAAIVRKPENISQIEKDLQHVCSHLLTMAKAKRKTADLVEKSKKVKGSLTSLRNKVKDKLKSVKKIEREFERESLLSAEKEKVKSIRLILVDIARNYSATMKDISKYCEKVMGKRPCSYAVVGLGSLARREITPYSDFEHVIVLEEGCQKKQNYQDILEYFRWFTVIFQVILINLGETMLPCLAIPSLNNFRTKDGNWYFDNVTKRGVSFDGWMPRACKSPLGQIEVSKHKPEKVELIKPVNEMLKYLTTEEDKKNGYLKDLLTKMCWVSGNKKIVKEFHKGVRDQLLDDDKETLVNEIKQQLKQDIDNFGIKFNLNNLLTNKTFNIKRVIYRSATLFLAALGRMHFIPNSSSFDIADKLVKEGVISTSEKHKLQYVVAVACEIRLRVYMEKESQDDWMDNPFLNEVQVPLFSAVGMHNLVNYFQIAYSLQSDLCWRLNVRKFHFYSNPHLVNISICYSLQYLHIIPTLLEALKKSPTIQSRLNRFGDVLKSLEMGMNDKDLHSSIDLHDRVDEFELKLQLYASFRDIAEYLQDNNCHDEACDYAELCLFVAKSINEKLINAPVVKRDFIGVSPSFYKASSICNFITEVLCNKDHPLSSSLLKTFGQVNSLNVFTVLLPRWITTCKAILQRLRNQHQEGQFTHENEGDCKNAICLLKLLHTIMVNLDTLLQAFSSMSTTHDPTDPCLERLNHALTQMERCWSELQTFFRSECKLDNHNYPNDKCFRFVLMTFGLGEFDSPEKQEFLKEFLNSLEIFLQLMSTGIINVTVISFENTARQIVAFLWLTAKAETLFESYKDICLKDVSGAEQFMNIQQKKHRKKSSFIVFLRERLYAVRNFLQILYILHKHHNQTGENTSTAIDLIELFYTLVDNLDTILLNLTNISLAKDSCMKKVKDGLALVVQNVHKLSKCINDFYFTQVETSGFRRFMSLPTKILCYNEMTRQLANEVVTFLENAEKITLRTTIEHVVKEAVKLETKILKENPADIIGTPLGNFISSLLKTNHRPQSLTRLQEAEKLYETILDGNPSPRLHSVKLCVGMGLIANMDKCPQTNKQLQEIHEHLSHLSRELNSDFELALAHTLLGICLHKMKQPDLSLKHLKHALESTQRTSICKETNQDVVGSLFRVAQCLFDMDKVSESLENFENALWIQRRISPDVETDSRAAELHFAIAACLKRMNQTNEALKHYLIAFQILKEKLAEATKSDYIDAKMLKKVGIGLLQMKRNAEALTCFINSLRILERSSDDEDVDKDIVDCLQQMKLTCKQIGKHEQADFYFKKYNRILT